MLKNLIREMMCDFANELLNSGHLDVETTWRDLIYICEVAIDKKFPDDEALYGVCKLLCSDVETKRDCAKR